jgi:putative ABC transport system permease protein
VGVAITVFAALTPAVRTSRTAPIEALRESAVDTAGASRLRVRIGTALTVVGVAGIVGFALGRGSTTVVGLAGAVALSGLLVLGPVLAVLAARVLGAPVARLRGVPGQLARRNIARAPKRTAAAAAALTIGVAIVTMFAVFGASLKTSTGANLSQTFTGNLVVSDSAADYATGGFSPEAADRIGALSGVAVSAGAGSGSALLDGTSEAVSVGDPTQLDRVFTLGLPAGQLAVDSTDAKAHGWQVGTIVRVTFEDGAVVPLRVGAIYPPIAPLSGYVVPSSLWVAHTTQPLNTAVYVAFAPGADTAAVTTQISAIAKSYGGLTVQDRAAYLSAEASSVDTLLAIVYVMLALAILIALLGIGNTLALAVYERTREIGLLRAVGGDRSHVRSTIRWESVLTALLGTTTGAVLGVLLGWAVVRAVSAAQQVGVVSIPWAQIVLVLVVGAIAGLLAGIRPARRAARLDPLAAIAAG